MIMKLPIGTIIDLSEITNLINSYEGLSDDGAIAIYENASEYEKIVKNEFVDKINGFVKKLQTDEFVELKEKTKDITDEENEDLIRFKELNKDAQDKINNYRETLLNQEFDITVNTISREDLLSIVKNSENRKKITRIGFRLIENLFVEKEEEPSEEIVEEEQIKE